MDTNINSAASELTLDQRLLNWASFSSLEESQIIQKLVAAIQESRDLEFWGSINILDVLPQPRFQANSGRETFARFILSLRNVLVFVPVALTWAAISKATSAFGTFSAQNQATTVNFLSFWQNGYGYLSSFWHIDTVAQFDVFVVLGVIILTLVLGRLNETNDREFTIGMNIAEEERIAIAVELQNYFHSRRRITDKDVPVAVATSVAGLRDMSREMSNAMADLRRVTANLINDTVPAVDHVGKELTDLTKTSTEKISDLVRTLSEGISSASKVLGDLSKTLTSVGSDTKDAVNRMVNLEGQLGKVGEKLGDSVKKFDSSVNQAKSGLDQGLSDAVSRATKAIDKIVNDMDKTNKSLKASAKDVQSEMQDLKRNLKRKFKIDDL